MRLNMRSIKSHIFISLLLVAAASLAQGVHYHPADHKPKPYSAEIVTTDVQTLEDGTKITKQHFSEYARDSEGRVRQGQTRAEHISADNPEPWKTINIKDPVSGQRIHFDTKERVAVVSQIPPKPPRPERPEPEPQPEEQPQVRRPRPEPPATTVTTNRNGQTIMTERLGMQTIEGVQARGMHITTTTPANSKLGNDKPIVNTAETWMSEELGVAVLMKVHDPVHGDHTTEYKNIRLGDPDMSLFTVPPGYTIKQAPVQPEPEPHP